ncbi:MAG TPA: hypothetical protein PKI11_19875 [Candidatus Hydrogenedentes bacterium]|nr:hypothetical protein [Candidatus Hydrogenedentota bacterium]HNT86844.1 hypothetical protein [Candidatus Hydrogenedentota bacterium]
MRRKLLQILYGHYMSDPLDVLGPEVFLEEGGMTRQELGVNMHYLADRGFVEMMIGYNPPLFAGVRIRPEGIDLVENHFEFNLRFPPGIDELEKGLAEMPVLVERLVEQADLSPLDGELRRRLQRDVQYLRDEVARPLALWRPHVIRAVLDWIAEPFEDPAANLPALPRLKEVLLEELAGRGGGAGRSDGSDGSVGSD